MSQKIREIPADVYDALELSAEATEGVGAGRMWDGGYDLTPIYTKVPYCLAGHASFVEVWEPLKLIAENTGVGRITIENAGVGRITIQNDVAVSRINKRLGVEDLRARVPFTLLMKEMKYVRGK